MLIPVNKTFLKSDLILLKTAINVSVIIKNSTKPILANLCKSSQL